MIKRKKLVAALALVALVVTISGTSAKQSYRMRSGLASWHDYSNDRTVKAKDRYALITASRDYPCGTMIKVFNKANKKFVIVRVADWGPARWTGRRLDLNKPAFRRIANIGSGEIRISYIVKSLGNCRKHRH